jgi:hypothetical protein
VNSQQWKSATSPRPKKTRKSFSKFKTMLIVFFDILGIVMAEWVPSGETVNQQLPRSIGEIARTNEKETTRIMEKRLDFAPRQRASPQRFVSEAVFS